MWISFSSCILTCLRPIVCDPDFIYSLCLIAGISNVVTPMYLTEIAPYNLRGAFGTLHQLAITFGIFCGSVFGLTHVLGKQVQPN